MLKQHITDAIKLEYTRVAYYYHKVGLTQDQIAKKMNISRQRVNRILRECVELGIVKISIEGLEKYYYELETLLEEKFGLIAVRIADTSDSADVNTALGTLAGAYLADILKPNDIIGFSRGKTMTSLVDNMPAITKDGLVVTQLMGGWNYESGNAVDDIIHRFSQKTGAITKSLFAPVIINNPELRRSIMTEPSFLESYKIIRSCTIAAVGIGDMDSMRQMLKMKFETIREEYHKHVEQNAVGEICTHFFDINGKPVSTSMDDHMIAIRREDFMRIPYRISVAGSQAKLDAITGALRGGYINVLITDQNTAEALSRL